MINNFIKLCGMPIFIEFFDFLILHQKIIFTGK